MPQHVVPRLVVYHLLITLCDGSFMTEVHVTKTTSSTSRLAQFASALRFEDLPAQVVEKAKTCLLDTLGCCLFGSTLDSVRKLTTFIASEGCGNQATVFGSRLRTSAANAALVNATGAHAFQLDEIHIKSTLHPGSLAGPVALNVAESIGNYDGKQLIAALVAGYEVGIRIGLACKGGMFTRGFHNQGTTGVFVAAACAARLLGLNHAQTVHALGIAGSQAAGLMAVQEGAMTKSFHSGRAAQSGVYAARLAQIGYTGIPDVLEAPYGGFLSALIGEGYSEKELCDELGEQWHILHVGFKPAPASNGSITAMAAMDKVMREHRLQAQDIERVTALVSTNTLHHCGWAYEAANVQGVLAAQMNLRYGIAVMALEREATVKQFTQEKLRDAAILAFIERIEVAVNPPYDESSGKYRVACKLRVRCRDGAQHESEVLYRKGSIEDSMSTSELDYKFVTLAKSALPESTARKIADAVAHMDNDGARELLRLLAAPVNT